MSGMEFRKFDLREKHLALLFSELHLRIRDLFRRVMQAWDCGPERPDNRQPLRPEHFPLGARGRDIVTRDGLIIATIAEPAMAEEITQRLNETEWKRQEDQWAL
jgi:hypothetical protein